MSTVLFGTVADTKDPESLGRVQVKLADYSGDIVLPWLRVVQPIASNASGFFWLPELEDQVVVLCGPGGTDGMVVIGSLYSGKRKPAFPDADGKNAIKQILTKAGNEITLDDTAGKEVITIKTKESKLFFKLDQAQETITVYAKAELVLLSDGNTSVAAVEKLSGNAKTLALEASDAASLKAAKIDISGSSKVTIAGAAIEIG